MARLILALVAVSGILFRVYAWSQWEFRELYSMLVIVLLDENAHAAQKAGLINFPRRTPALNARDLSAQTFHSFCAVAHTLAASSIIGAPAHLWQAKQDAEGEELP